MLIFNVCAALAALDYVKKSQRASRLPDGTMTTSQFEAALQGETLGLRRRLQTAEEALRQTRMNPPSSASEDARLASLAVAATPGLGLLRIGSPQFVPSAAGLPLALAPPTPLVAPADPPSPDRGAPAPGSVDPDSFETASQQVAVYAPPGIGLQARAREAIPAQARQELEEGQQDGETSSTWSRRRKHLRAAI